MAIAVGKIARMFGISRTTLLYYESIGLIRPVERNNAGYRLYNDDDVERLRKIMLFREVGVPLEDISKLILASEFDMSAALLRRLSCLNSEIALIKVQQEIIVKLLKSNQLSLYKQDRDDKKWISITEAAGISKESMLKWHVEFEKHSPEQHYGFLKMLGFSEERIKEMTEKINKYIGSEEK